MNSELVNSLAKMISSPPPISFPPVFGFVTRRFLHRISQTQSPLSQPTSPATLSDSFPGNVRIDSIVRKQVSSSFMPYPQIIRHFPSSVADLVAAATTVHAEVAVSTTKQHTSVAKTEPYRFIYQSFTSFRRTIETTHSLPDLWEHFFLTHLLHIKIWYHFLLWLCLQSVNYLLHPVEEEGVHPLASMESYFTIFRSLTCMIPYCFPIRVAVFQLIETRCLIPQRDERLPSTRLSNTKRRIKR
ncbi:unnamed protein product [Lactuca virosa]|uniref:Putative E3 ubiquitin-protein ligase LIN N-terminal domain-containing protein n=1 Tax=Lactuca virosa TaxID=75947 RepID=A0AAU9M1T6_9ASTR|nr:unnamed protein product [Lactuca virosa]